MKPRLMWLGQRVLVFVLEGLTLCFCFFWGGSWWYPFGGFEMFDSMLVFGS